MAKPASQIRSTFGAIKPPFHLVMQPSRDHEQCPAVLWPKRVMLCSIYKSCNVWFKGRVPKIRPWRMTPSDLYAVYTTAGNWPNRPWFDRFWIGSSLWSHQSLLCSPKYMVDMTDSGPCTICNIGKGQDVFDSIQSPPIIVDVHTQKVSFIVLHIEWFPSGR